MSTKEDKGLVYKLHDDDIGAFDALYQKYHQAIYRNIYKLTKNNEISRRSDHERRRGGTCFGKSD